MYTDLFVHQLTHLITAMGVRFPRRVVGAGGLYLEYDGRDVPDVATVVADYDEGCQVIISATMCNDVQLPEVIRGHTATIKFDAQPQRRLRGRPAEARRPARPSGNQPGRGRRQVPPRPAPRGHPRPLGALPRVPAVAQPRDPLPGRPRLRGDHHGQPGRPVVPRRQGLLLQQGERPGRRRRRLPGRPLGRAEPPPRQAQPGHRLEGRRHRLAAPAPGLPEARRRLDRRQGPGGKRLSLDRLNIALPDPRRAALPASPALIDDRPGSDLFTLARATHRPRRCA